MAASPEIIRGKITIKRPPPIIKIFELIKKRNTKLKKTAKSEKACAGGK